MTESLVWYVAFRGPNLPSRFLWKGWQDVADGLFTIVADTGNARRFLTEADARKAIDALLKAHPQTLYGTEVYACPIEEVP